MPATPWEHVFVLAVLPLILVSYAGASSTAVSLADVTALRTIDEKFEHVARLALEDPTTCVTVADEILETLDSTLWRGRFENLAGIALARSGHAEEGRRRFERAAATFRKGGHTKQLGQMRLNLGLEALNRGAYADGIRQLVEAERAALADGDPTIQAWVYFNLANAHIEAAASGEDVEAAQSYLLRGLNAIGPDAPSIATGEFRLGVAPTDKAALTQWRQRELDLEARFVAYELLTTIAFLQGDTPDALRWSHRLVLVSKALERRLKYVSAANLRAAVLILDGQVEEGRPAFDETFEELKTYDARLVTSAAAAYGARAHLSAGRMDRALALAHEVIPPVGGSNVPTRIALETLVKVYKAKGQPEKALIHSEALNERLRRFAMENGRLIRASFAAQRRSEQAELEARAQQAMLAAAGLGLALLLGFCVVLYRWWRRSARDARASQTVSALQRTLNRELRHRFGNHLATLRAAVERHRNDEPAHRLDRIRQSIEAMSALDSVISSTDEHSEAVDLGDYLETLLSLNEEIYAPRADVTWSVDAEPVRLEPKRAFLVGLAVAEAVSNAFRHGFEAHGVGTVRVSVKHEGANVVVAIEDDGEGLGRPVRRDGRSAHQGLDILEDMSRYLSGTLALETAHPGSPRPGLRVVLRLSTASESALQAVPLSPPRPKSTPKTMAERSLPVGAAISRG